MVLKVGGGQFCERTKEKNFLTPTFWPVRGIFSVVIFVFWC